MDIGISYWFGYPSFPEERTHLIKQAGFTNVSLHWTNEYESITGDKYSIPKILERNDIAISSFHLSFEQSPLLWDPYEKGISYRREVIKSIDDACSFGVKTIVMHSDGRIMDGLDLNYFLEPLYERAAKKCVTLCLENLQHEDNLERILTTKGFQNTPVCYDFGHANIRTSPISCSRNPNIRYFHIHDNDGKNDSHTIPSLKFISQQENINILSYYRDIPKILEVHGHILNHEEAGKYLFKAKKIVQIMQKV